MHTLRPLPVLICALAVAWVVGCSRTDMKSMQPVLDKISHSSESELPGLLYGYNQSSPGAQKVLLGMLRPLHAPLPEQHMSIEAVRQSGQFTMIVARVPWPSGPQSAGLHPIIITGDPGKEQVVGYVLPFNDVFKLIETADRQSISQLSQWWIEHYALRGGNGI